MIAECIASGLLGFFIGGVWIGSEINAISKEKERLIEENNHLKRFEDFHIDQVVYACKFNSFYMGEITKMTHSKNETLIELDKKEVFRICNIYTDKNEALQQIKIEQ